MREIEPAEAHQLEPTEVFQLTGRVSVNTDEAVKAIKRITKAAEKAKSALEDLAAFKLTLALDD